MAIRKSFVRFDKILVASLGILLGLIGLVLAYEAVTTSSEIRSKAAEEQTIYKRWEFNGTTTEGWINDNARVVSGALFAIVPGGGVSGQNFDNNSVATTIPKGLKTVEVRMSVSPPGIRPGPSPRCPPNVACDYDTITTSSVPVSQFRMDVLYRREGGPPYEQSTPQYGPSDGIMRTYRFTLPTVDQFTMEHLQLAISQLTAKSRIAIDWIRIVGTGGSSKPTSTGNVIQGTIIKPSSFPSPFFAPSATVTKPHLIY